VIITLDLSQVPPGVGLEDADDFRTLKVDVRQADDATIHPDELRRLAGDAASQPGWEQGFTRMLEFAAHHGWMDGDLVKVHLECDGAAWCAPRQPLDP
jgi:hypothetical protein